MSSTDVTVVSLSTSCWGAEQSLLTLASHARGRVRVAAPAGELLVEAERLAIPTAVLTSAAVLRCSDVGRSVGPAALPAVLIRACAALVREPLWDRGPVVSFSQWLHLPLAAAGRIRRHRVALDLHDGPFSPAGAVVQALAAFTAGRSVACSETALRHIGRWPQGRVSVLPRPVSLPDELAGHQRPDGPARRPFRLVIVGRLDPEKGVLVALGALERLRAAGVPTVLDVVGAPHRTSAEPLDPSRWPDAVFHGRLPYGEALRVVGQADVLLSLAPGEAFGRTIVEAALLQVPSVVVGGGPREQVQPDRTGWVSPPGDPAALAAVLRRLAADPARVAAAGHAARQDALARCDPDRVTAAWLAAVQA